jgi:hypothetical protein
MTVRIPSAWAEAAKSKSNVLNATMEIVMKSTVLKSVVLAIAFSAPAPGYAQMPGSLDENTAPPTVIAPTLTPPTQTSPNALSPIGLNSMPLRLILPRQSQATGGRR